MPVTLLKKKGGKANVAKSTHAKQKKNINNHEQTNLEKNLLKMTNNVVKKLLTVSHFTNFYEVVDSQGPEPGLLINKTPVNDMQDPVGEAIGIFENLASNETIDTAVLIGFDMGYAPFCFSKNFNGNTIIFDPDLESVIFALTVNDLSEIFDEHTQLTVDSETFTQMFLASFNPAGTTHIVANKYYTEKYKDLVTELRGQIQAIYDTNT